MYNHWNVPIPGFHPTQGVSSAPPLPPGPPPQLFIPPPPPPGLLPTPRWPPAANNYQFNPWIGGRQPQYNSWNNYHPPAVPNYQQGPPIWRFPPAQHQPRPPVQQNPNWSRSNTTTATQSSSSMSKPSLPPDRPKVLTNKEKKRLRRKERQKSSNNGSCANINAYQAYKRTWNYPQNQSGNKYGAPPQQVKQNPNNPAPTSATQRPFSSNTNASTTPATTTKKNNASNSSTLPVKKPYKPPRKHGSISKPRTPAEWRILLQNQMAQVNAASLITHPVKPIKKPFLGKRKSVPLPMNKFKAKVSKETAPTGTGSLEDAKHSVFRNALEAVARRLTTPGPPITPTLKGVLIRNLVYAVDEEWGDDWHLDVEYVSFYLESIARTLKTNGRHWRPYLWAYVAILHRLKIPGKDTRFSVVRSLFDHILNSGYVKLVEDVGELEVIRNYWGLHLLDSNGNPGKDKVVNCTLASVETKLTSRYAKISTKTASTDPMDWDEYVIHMLTTSTFDKLYPPQVFNYVYALPLFRGTPKPPTKIRAQTLSKGGQQVNKNKNSRLPELAEGVIFDSSTYNASLQTSTNKNKTADAIKSPKITSIINPVQIMASNTGSQSSKTANKIKSPKTISIINPVQIMTRPVTEKSNKDKDLTAEVPQRKESSMAISPPHAVPRPDDEKSKEDQNKDKDKDLAVLEVIEVPQRKESDIVILPRVNGPLRLPVESDGDSWLPKRNNNRGSGLSNHTSPALPAIVPAVADKVTPISSTSPTAISSPSISRSFSTAIRVRHANLPVGNHCLQKSSIPVAVVVGQRNTSQSSVTPPPPRPKPKPIQKPSPSTLMPPPPPPSRKLTTAEIAKEKIRRSQQPPQTTANVNPVQPSTASSASSSSSSKSSTSKPANIVPQRYQPLSYFVYPEDLNNPNIGGRKDPKSLRQQQILRAMGTNEKIPQRLRILPNPPVVDPTDLDPSSEDDPEQICEICPKAHDEFPLPVGYTDEDYVNLVLAPKFCSQCLKHIEGLWQIVMYHHRDDSTNV